MPSAIALYTGGKDSHYAILKAIMRGVKIKALIIVESLRKDSWMFHTVNINNAIIHSKIMSIPHIIFRVSGIKEIEIHELLEKIRESKIIDEDTEYIISGAVASKYQRIRVDNLARKLGLKHYSPLWGYDQERLLIEEANELSFIITAIQAYGMPLKWLGRVINSLNVHDLIKDLRKFSISPVGEGGEFETYVISSPLFHGISLKIHKATIVHFPEHFAGYYLIEKISY